MRVRACGRERRGGWRIERRMEMKERKKEGEGNPEKGVRQTEKERQSPTLCGLRDCPASDRDREGRGGPGKLRDLPGQVRKLRVPVTVTQA